MFHTNILLFLTSCLVRLNSCGGDTPKDKLNEIKSDPSNFEEGVSSAMDYNDGVISELSLLDLKTYSLEKHFEKGLDDDYVGFYEECMNEYQRVSRVIRKVAPAGIGGADFKASALEYIDSYGAMLKSYDPVSLTRILEQIESDETLSIMEMVSAMDSAIEDYQKKYNMLSEAQKIFASRNDVKIEEEAYDLDELYEETK